MSASLGSKSHGAPRGKSCRGHSNIFFFSMPRRRQMTSATFVLKKSYKSKVEATRSYTVSRQFLSSQMEYMVFISFFIHVWEAVYFLSPCVTDNERVACTLILSLYIYISGKCQRRVHTRELNSRRGGETERRNFYFTHTWVRTEKVPPRKVSPTRGSPPRALSLWASPCAKTRETESFFVVRATQRIYTCVEKISFFFAHRPREAAVDLRPDLCRSRRNFSFIGAKLARVPRISRPPPPSRKILSRRYLCTPHRNGPIWQNNVKIRAWAF